MLISHVISDVISGVVSNLTNKLFLLKQFNAEIWILNLINEQNILNEH